MKINYRSTSVRFLSWLGLALALLLITMFNQPMLQASQARSTVPPVSETFVKLVGPVEDQSSTTIWMVAGIRVDVTNARINERMGAAARGTWARVEGISDGNGGLIAQRVKVLPQQPFIRIEGQLQTLSTTTLQVGGLALARTVTTIVAGHPAVGDRVQVAAALDANGALLALRLHKAGQHDNDDNDPDDDAETGHTHLIGVIQARPTAGRVGIWKISGISVESIANTEINERVGPLMVGSWVKVEGVSDGNGGLRASEIRAFRSQSTHKLEGTLSSLSASAVVVDGVAVPLDASVQIKKNPTPGQPVQVRAVLHSDGTLRAILVQGKGEDDDDEDGLIRLKGTVRRAARRWVGRVADRRSHGHRHRGHAD